MPAENTASYTCEVTNSALAPSSKDEARVALAPSSKDEAALAPLIRDEVCRVAKDTPCTPSFRVKGFRSIALSNSTTSSVITKLRSIAKRVYLGVR